MAVDRPMTWKELATENTKLKTKNATITEQVAVLAEAAQEYMTTGYVSSRYALKNVLADIPEAAKRLLAQVVAGDAAQSYLDVLRDSALWQLYDTGDGMRPCCKQCGEDSETCCCDNIIRETLNIVPPVDDVGNIVDQEAFDVALEAWRKAKEATDG